MFEQGALPDIQFVHGAHMSRELRSLWFPFPTQLGGDFLGLQLMLNYLTIFLLRSNNRRETRTLSSLVPTLIAGGIRGSVRCRAPHVTKKKEEEKIETMILG